MIKTILEIRHIITRLYYYADIFRVTSENLDGIGFKDELIDSIDELIKELNDLKKTVKNETHK